MNSCRYGAGKVSSGANVDGAPLPEDVEENGKEEEVGEFGFHTLVGPLRLSQPHVFSHQALCVTQQVYAIYPSHIILDILKMCMGAFQEQVLQQQQQQEIIDKQESLCQVVDTLTPCGQEQVLTSHASGLQLLFDMYTLCRTAPIP